MAEVKSYNLLSNPTNWGGGGGEGGKRQVPQVPWPSNKIPFVGYIYMFICVFLMQNTSLSNSSKFVALRLRLLQRYQPVC